MEANPIEIAISDYETHRQTFISFIEKKHEQLSKYAEKETANKWVIDTGNKEIEACFEFLEKTDDIIIQLKKEAEDRAHWERMYYFCLENSEKII